MATYKELQSQLAEFSRKAEEARETEVQRVIDAIRTKVAEYGLTEKDIFGRRRGGRHTAKAPAGAPKYRDPKTGAEWSGHGRPPAWIKDAKDRSRFLIAGADVETTAASKRAARKAVGKKASPAKKTAVKRVAATKAAGKKSAGRARRGKEPVPATADESASAQSA